MSFNFLPFVTEERAVLTDGTLPSPSFISSKMTLAPSGVHLLPFQRGFMGCYFWRDLADLQEVIISATLSPSDPVAQLLGDRFIYADMVAGLGVKISEWRYDGQALAPLNSLMVGDADTRWPHMVPTLEGGLFLIAHRHWNEVGLDVAYRTPLGQWTSRYFTLYKHNSIPSCNVTCQMGSDGFLYCFVARDSSHQISLAVLTQHNGIPELANVRPDLLSWADGDMSPHGEHPFLWSAPGLLLSYCNKSQQLVCGEDCAHPVITRIAEGTLEKSLVLLPETLVEREDYTPIFANPLGVDQLPFAVDSYNCQTKAWCMNRLVYGAEPITDSEIIAGLAGNMMAASPDGYFCYRRPDRIYTFARLALTRLAPELKIERTATGVKLWADLTETTLDFDLEESESPNGPWAHVEAFDGSFYAPSDKPCRFYRLKQRGTA